MGAVGLGLPSAMLVPGAWRELWAWLCRRAYRFPGHDGNCGPVAGASHVASRGMAGPVCSSLLLAMLVPGAWQHLWTRVCRQPCWFLAHGGSFGIRAAARHVDSRGMAAAVGPGLPGGHFGSRGIAGAVGPGLPPAAILVLLAVWELWAWG